MINIEKEAKAIATEYRPRLGEYVEDLGAAIESLCTRYADEKLEEAAKVCDAINDKYETGAITETDRWKDKAAEVALECATAIRSRKGDER